MVIPIGRKNNSMFEDSAFDLDRFIKDCTDFYGVPPRPHWATSYYGGHVCLSSSSSYFNLLCFLLDKWLFLLPGMETRKER